MAARAGGRGLGLGDRAATGRGGRTGAAAPGQQTSEGGGGGAAQGLGFFRTVGGEDMNARLAFIAAHMAEHGGRPPQEPSAPPGVRFLSVRFGRSSRLAGNGTAPLGFTP